ncbi:MAG: methyltransferase type 11, partial [Halothiobacillaceae bacterium]
MERQAEPELMDDRAQAQAYAQADFAEPHNHFMQLFRERCAATTLRGTVLDLGCGAADITIRFAQMYPQTQLVGIDGAAAMLACGAEAVTRAGLQARISLELALLPGDVLP